MRTFLLLTLWLLNSVLLAQDFDNYQPLQSTGEIPKAFRTLSGDKYQKDRGQIDQNQSRVLRKTKEDFYLKSNFLVDEILLSGKVLFNDPVTTYVNKVADEILKDDPELREDLQIYVVKSPIVNAFTTNNGIVLVNLGLLAQLENEAQLAFVLSHEFVHYKNNHVINSYVENTKIERGQGGYQRTTFDDKLLAKSKYSKELEFEADREGLDAYLETSYDLEAVNGVFDVLQYSYLPYDDVEFKKDFLSTPYFDFPEDYYLEEITPISGEEDYDDSKSTHPNTRKRRKAVNRELNETSNEEREVFLVSEIEFLSVQQLARFEMVRLYLLDRDYANSLYTAYLLLQNNPNNSYLRKAVVKSLYGMAKYKNAGLLSDVLAKHTRIEGESQQLNFLMQQLSGQEMTLLAMIHAWNLYLEFPEDAYLKAASEDLMNELVFEYDVQPKDFSKKPKMAEEKKESAIDSLASKDPSELTKYEKIKLKKQKTNLEEEKNFMHYSLAGLFQNKKFANAFDETVEDFKEKNDRENVSTQVAAQEFLDAYNEERLNRRKGLALGIKNIVIVDPVYKKVDQRKRDAVKYLKSEEGQQAYVSTIERNADLAKLDVSLLDTKAFRADDVELFNDFAALNDWVGERFDHEDLDFVVSDHNRMMELTEKYGTDYFAWTGVVAMRERKAYAALYVCLGAMTIYGLPFALAYAAVPEYDTFFYFMLFDVPNGEAVMVERIYIDGKDRLDMMNSFVYDAFFQVKHKRK
ncbi:MAG: M48 family metallopeptidase [Salibacteraceae bacterium]